MKAPQSILITGASSGIGAALALEYAREYAGQGVRLALSGRDGERLEAVAQQCREMGALVTTCLVPVTDRVAMAAWIGQTDSAHPLDLVIANAGVSGGAGTVNGENEDQARAIFEVNFTGVLNTLGPAIEAMRRHAPDTDGHRGQIALTSSMAALAPLPGAPAYATSKAAVKVYGEALHGALKPEGIVVTSICPGFVRSRITDQNTFPMPFFMEAPKAASIIRRGLQKRRISVIFPWPVALLTGLIGRLPPCWRSWILSRAPKKS